MSNTQTPYFKPRFKQINIFWMDKSKGIQGRKYGITEKYTRNFDMYVTPYVSSLMAEKDSELLQQTLMSSIPAWI